MTRAETIHLDIARRWSNALDLLSDEVMDAYQNPDDFMDVLCALSDEAEAELRAIRAQFIDNFYGAESLPLS